MRENFNSLLGAAGLMNRSSRPHVCPHATPMATVAQALQRRRDRQTYRIIVHDLVLACRAYWRMKRRRATDSINRCSGLLLPPGRHVRTSLLR